MSLRRFFRTHADVRAARAKAGGKETVYAKNANGAKAQAVSPKTFLFDKEIDLYSFPLSLLKLPRILDLEDARGPCIVENYGVE